RRRSVGAEVGDEWRFYQVGSYGVFFFSSRRRHTRWPRDWSSDVCSSDLALGRPMMETKPEWKVMIMPAFLWRERQARSGSLLFRSEERRVGKECRSLWSADH